MTDPTISVVIPALDEERSIGAALASIRRAPGVQAVVVDGGSCDRTAAIAADLGATVLRSVPPRSLQMNVGAKMAGGELLVFLHADAVLPPGFDREVRTTLRKPGVALGAFALGIDGQARSLRRVERVANWRATRWGMPYGDQALFVSRNLFETMGGFPEFPIMEDFAFVRRAHRFGRVCVSRQIVLTSARRWDALGTWRTTLINQSVIVGYLLGVAPERIARWYNRAGALSSRRAGLQDEVRRWP